MCGGDRDVYGRCAENLTCDHGRTKQGHVINIGICQEQGDVSICFIIGINARGGHLVPDVLSCAYKKTRERVPFFKLGTRGPAFRGANSTII